jgi:hypothetical protein
VSDDSARGPYERAIRQRRKGFPYTDELRTARLADALLEALEGWKAALAKADLDPARLGLARLEIANIEARLARAMKEMGL